MPSFMTHGIFGEQILEQLGSDAFPTEEEREAFLLGNQGPDPFFYTLIRLSNQRIKHVGRALHRTCAIESIDAMIQYLKFIRPADRPIVQAYICGYICHHSLDRTAHPFVYSIQNQLINSGVEGISDAGTQVHGQIEADLDSMMLWQTRGLRLDQYLPYRELLKADSHVLAVLDRLIRFTVAGGCKTWLQPGTFSRAIRDMRFGIRGLYSPRGIKRTTLGHIERIARKHSLVQAMSSRPEVTESCDFDNRDHDEWINPFTGEHSTESFLDLYARAKNVAFAEMQRFLSGADAASITEGFDFRGAPA